MSSRRCPCSRRPRSWSRRATEDAPLVLPGYVGGGGWPAGVEPPADRRETWVAPSGTAPAASWRFARTAARARAAERTRREGCSARVPERIAAGDRAPSSAGAGRSSTRRPGTNPLPCAGNGSCGPSDPLRPPGSLSVIAYADGSGYTARIVRRAAPSSSPRSRAGAVWCSTTARAGRARKRTPSPRDRDSLRRGLRPGADAPAGDERGVPPPPLRGALGLALRPARGLRRPTPHPPPLTRA